MQHVFTAVAILWTAFSVLIGGTITAFYAAALGVLHTGWLLLMKWWTSWNPAHHIPFVWLSTLAATFYWALLGVRWDVQNEVIDPHPGPKVVEANHGSFMELFLVYWVILQFIRGDLVIVVKQELAEHPVGKWLIVKPMQYIDRIILIDRSNREAALAAIRDYLDRNGASPDLLIVIFCDQTRPTDKKRAQQNKAHGSTWRRVLRPSRGGAWLITHLLAELTGGQLQRFEVCHGFSRPQQTEIDLHRILGARYWARIRRITDPLPATAEAYGPMLTARWEEMDQELVARQET